MIYIFDLDGTLCTQDGSKVYEAEPYMDRIIKVNRLFEKGHTIFIDTARGALTGKDHFERTEKQLKEWGLKYTRLRTNTKFFGDWYIDDKALSDKEFFK